MKSSRYDGPSIISKEQRTGASMPCGQKPRRMRNGLSAAIRYVVPSLDFLIDTSSQLNTTERRSIHTDRLTAAAERDAKMVDWESQ